MTTPNLKIVRNKPASEDSYKPVAVGFAKRLIIVTFLLRATIWLIWVLLIATDGIAASHDLKSGLYWLPWVGIGLLMAWVLDDWIREDRGLAIALLIIPYLILADFVQG